MLWNLLRRMLLLDHQTGHGRHRRRHRGQRRRLTVGRTALMIAAAAAAVIVLLDAQRRPKTKWVDRILTIYRNTHVKYNYKLISPRCRELGGGFGSVGMGEDCSTSSTIRTPIDIHPYGKQLYFRSLLLAVVIILLAIWSSSPSLF